MYVYVREEWELKQDCKHGFDIVAISDFFCHEPMLEWSVDDNVYPRLALEAAASKEVRKKHIWW